MSQKTTSIISFNTLSFPIEVKVESVYNFYEPLEDRTLPAIYLKLEKENKNGTNSYIEVSWRDNTNKPLIPRYNKISWQPKWGNIGIQNEDELNKMSYNIFNNLMKRNLFSKPTLQTTEIRNSVEVNAQYFSNILPKVSAYSVVPTTNSGKIYNVTQNATLYDIGLKNNNEGGIVSVNPKYINILNNFWGSEMMWSPLKKEEKFDYANGMLNDDEFFQDKELPTWVVTSNFLRQTSDEILNRLGKQTYIGYMITKDKYNKTMGRWILEELIFIPSMYAISYKDPRVIYGQQYRYSVSCLNMFYNTVTITNAVNYDNSKPDTQHSANKNKSNKEDTIKAGMSTTSQEYVALKLSTSKKGRGNYNPLIELLRQSNNPFMNREVLSGAVLHSCPSSFVSVTVKDKTKPPPPSALVVNLLPNNNIILDIHNTEFATEHYTLDEKGNPKFDDKLEAANQGDVTGYLIQRRLANSNGLRSADWNIYKITSNTRTFIDNEINPETLKEIGYVYTIRAIDRHNNISNTSAHIKITGFVYKGIPKTKLEQIFSSGLSDEQILNNIKKKHLLNKNIRIKNKDNTTKIIIEIGKSVPVSEKVRKIYIYNCSTGEVFAQNIQIQKNIASYNDIKDAIEEPLKKSFETQENPFDFDFGKWQKQKQFLFLQPN